MSFYKYSIFFYMLLMVSITRILKSYSKAISSVRSSTYLNFKYFCPFQREVARTMLFQRQTQHSLIHKALCSFIHTFYQSYSAILHSFIHSVTGTVNGFNVWFMQNFFNNNNKQTVGRTIRNHNKQTRRCVHSYIHSIIHNLRSFIHSFLQ